MDNPSEEEVKAAAEAAFQESVKMCEGFTSRQLSVNGLSVGNYRIMRAALIAAAQVRAKTNVSVAATELRDIREMVEHWASYASEYFRDKHDLAGDLAKIDALLSASGGNRD